MRTFATKELFFARGCAIIANKNELVGGCILLIVYAIPIAAVDPDDSACRAHLSKERLEQIDRKNEAARRQSFAASLLLEYAVAEQFPAVVHPLSISVTESGKPYLVNEPMLHFNLSHSGEWAVCAISDQPVGVDIERCIEGRAQIAERFFHKEEVRYLRLLAGREQDQGFCRLWTLKESFVKATGRGLALPLRSFCVSVRHTTPVLVEGASEPCSMFFIPFAAAPNYCLAVTSLAAQAAPPIFKLIA